MDIRLPDYILFSRSSLTTFVVLLNISIVCHQHLSHSTYNCPLNLRLLQIPQCIQYYNQALCIFSSELPCPHFIPLIAMSQKYNYSQLMTVGFPSSFLYQSIFSIIFAAYFHIIVTSTKIRFL